MTCDLHVCEWGYNSHLYQESEKLRNISTCLVENQNFNISSVDNETIIDVTIQGSYDDTVLGFAMINNENDHFLPVDIAEKFPNLTDFQASDSLVTTIGNNHFKGLAELVRLNLKGNKIESFSDHAFSDCKKLEFIDLSFNKLKTLPADIFRDLPNLGDVDVMNNELVELPKDLFVDNPKFQYFCGCYNKIQFIDATVFDHSVVLKKVLLVDNVCVNGTYEFNFLQLKEDLAANCTGTQAV